MKKLSFIVPIYNVEQYFRKCVDSLLRQDYSDYEIILVDDGSTDNSSQICDEYVRAFENGDLKLEIKCIHQENGGLSAARNAGLRVAKGEYVCFVDSDDYWEENVLGGLMEQIEKEQLDVLRFDYQNVRLVESQELRANSLHKIFQPYKYPHAVDKRKEVVDGETYLNTRMPYTCYAWAFILRREIVPLFTEGLHFEDVEWLPRMMLSAERVNSTTTVVYNYFWRDGSITLTQGNASKVRKNVEDNMTIIAQYNRYVQLYPNCLWLREMRSSIVVSVLANIAQYLYIERKEYIKRLKEMNVFPLTLVEKQGKTYLRKARLMNFSPRLAVELLHLKNI